MTDVSHISELSSPAFAKLAAAGNLVVLLPVGSVEPHGPHMSLTTDTTISIGAARRAAALLAADDIVAVLAPPVAYGVTECAAAFPGAVSIGASTLTAFLADVARGYLGSGVAHVCLINNHLEPAHDSAVREAVKGIDGASVACPLERRWARTLSAEFKSGACHAGQYETSLILAEAPGGVDTAVCAGLAANPASLSEALAKGITDFVEMGLPDAYAGDPASATADEGEALYGRLAEMVRTTVLEALPRDGRGQ